MKTTNKFTLLTITILAVLLSLTSCDNEIHLCDEWRETTVIYGMIDAADTFTDLRVYKAFLGEGNAYDMAKIVDSSEYDPSEISVKMEKWHKVNNQDVLVRTIDFEPYYSYNKEPGTFYNERQLYFRANTLGKIIDMIPITDSTFIDDYETTKLKVIVINKSGDTITATTPVVKPDTYVTVSRDHGTETRAATIYKNLRFPSNVSWTAVTNGSRYEVYADFNIIEVLTNGDTISRTIPRGIVATKTLASNGNNTTFSYDDYASGFFAFVEANTPYSDPAMEASVAYRKVRLYMLTFAMADEAFQNYMVTSRGTGMSQNLNVYSNVKNGRGLVCSRANLVFPCQISEEAKTELFENPDYDYLKFKNE